MDKQTRDGEQSNNNTAMVDCQAGRNLGCSTFCCRLHVRLKDHERPQFNGAGTLEKGEDGLCSFLDRKNYLCSIWDKRPSVCREYTCNDDDLLQIVLREGFTDLKTLALSKLFIPKETYIKIPVTDNEN